MTGPVIFSYALNGPAAGRRLEGEEIARYLEDDALGWVHLDATDPEVRGWLHRNLPYLDPYTLDALLSEETRPRATELGEGMLVILRGINPGEGQEPADMVSIRLWIDPHRIVSLHRRPVDAVRDLEERIRGGRGPATAGQFLVQFIARLTARVEPHVTDIDEIVDDLETEVVLNAHPDLRRRIVEARQRAIHFRRHIAPQRDAVSLLRSSDIDWIDPTTRRGLVEVHDRLTRLIEELDALRERLQVVRDELANSLADRLNRNMYVLSVIAAIFLPLGFLTGLMGINVPGIPGAENPNAFWIFTGILAALVVVQVAIFRWLRWF